MRFLVLEPPLSVEPQGIFPRHPPHYGLFAAAVLRDLGADVTVLDAFLEDLSPAEAARRAIEARPDVAVILPFDYTRETEPRVSLDLAARIREGSPATVVGLGGSVDAPFLQRLMEAQPAVDFAMLGEYERTVAALARSSGRDLDAIPGLLVRRDGAVVPTGPAEVVEDLDTLPFPAWDLIDFRRYTFIPHRYKRVPMYPLLAGRGCPYACLSCKEAKYAKITRYRVRSVPDVLREIRFAMERYGAREIQFSDATFGIRKEWVLELCAALRGEGIDVTWSALMRADLMTPDVLRPMAGAGCWNVLVGVESANQHALDRMGKRITPEMARRAVRDAREAGITVTASFMLGLPGEDRADVLRTIDLAVDLDPDYAQFFVPKYYGADDGWDRWGTVQADWDLSPYDFRGPVFVAHAFRDVAELKDLQRLAYRRFYLRPRYIARHLPELLSPSQALRLVRGAATLARAVVARPARP